MPVITQSQFYNEYKNKYIKIGGGTANNVDWNGTNGYAGQCATLAREYIVQCYGYQDKPYGNGADFVNIPKGTKLKNPEDWCLIVWPKHSGLPYGHVAIYYKGKMISQNPNKVALITIWAGKKYYIRPYQYKKSNEAEVIKAMQLLANNGRITLPADRAIYPSIPKKKTPYKKVIVKGSYFFNGLYLYSKPEYRGVDSKGRKCHFVRVFDLNGMKPLGFIPIYASDVIQENTRKTITYPKI